MSTSRSLLTSACLISVGFAAWFKATAQAEGPPVIASSNPVVYFEIRVTDMDRAIAFYEAVFGYTLERAVVDGYEMAFFPQDRGRSGASGALAKGDVYKPSRKGAILYFSVEDIKAVLKKAADHGADILYDVKDIGQAGFVAEFEDSEGNRIALTQAKA